MKTIIRKFTLGHPWQVVVPSMCIFIENIFSAGPGIAAYFAINLFVQGIQNPLELDMNALWNLALAMGIMIVLQFLACMLGFFGTYIPATNHSAENKIAMVKKLRTLPLGYFQKKQTGELINTFTSDFTAIEQSMVGPFTGLFSMAFFSIWAGTILFLFNQKLATAFYICIPLSVITVIASMRITSKLSNKSIVAKDKAMTYLNEYLSGMRTLKSYNQTGKGFANLKNAYWQLMQANIKSETVGGVLLNLAYTFIQIGIPMVCFIGAYMILGEEVSIVDYLAIIVFSTKVISPLLTWAQYTVMLRSDYISANRIDTVMNQESLSGEKEVDINQTIHFEHVSFSYQGTSDEKALDDVTFLIPSGKLTAIVGPSGSGKSTILRLLARFWDVNEGQIVCGNTKLSETNADRWLNQISMVLQDVYLFHESIRENILFGRPDASEEEMIMAAKQAQCHDFIMSLPDGYDTIVGEGGSTLSGGEKQRISIARAILKNAPLLLLDEPTASLDARNEVMIQRAIGDLVKGRTVVMIAHRLKTIKHADQILVVDKGKIVEQGKHEELLEQKGLYYRLWRLQNEIHNWKL